MPRSLPLRSARRTLPLAAGLAAAVLLTGCSVGTTGGAGADGDLGNGGASDPDPGQLVYRTPTAVTD